MLIPPVHPRLWTAQQVAQIANRNEGANGTQRQERSAVILESQNENSQTTEKYHHIQRQTERRAHCFGVAPGLNRPNTLPARRQGHASKVGQKGCGDALPPQEIRKLCCRKRASDPPNGKRNGESESAHREGRHDNHGHARDIEPSGADVCPTALGGDGRNPKQHQRETACAYVHPTQPLKQVCHCDSPFAFERELCAWIPRTMSASPDVHALPCAESYGGGKQPGEDRQEIRGRAGTTPFPYFSSPQGAPPSACGAVREISMYAADQRAHP